MDTKCGPWEGEKGGYDEAGGQAGLDNGPGPRGLMSRGRYCGGICGKGFRTTLLGDTANLLGDRVNLWEGPGRFFGGHGPGGHSECRVAPGERARATGPASAF